MQLDKPWAGNPETRFGCASNGATGAVGKVLVASEWRKDDGKSPGGMAPV